jgi:CRP-like cAMP-binding protein
MYPELLSHIKRYVQLTADEERLLCEKIEVKKVKKKEYLLEPGKICKGSYFVVKGLVRQFFLDDKLNEKIILFGLENWWVADQDSLLNHQPSTFYIQAIEHSEFLFLAENDRVLLFKEIPLLESYFRQMIQIAFVMAQRRLCFISTQNDEERYRHFSARFPGFLQRVPQYMLASYLGFTPQFLSRLRAKKV